MHLVILISHMEVPQSFTHTSKPSLNKLYNYIKKNVYYSGNPKGELRTNILWYCIKIQTTYHILEPRHQIKCHLGP